MPHLRHELVLRDFSSDVEQSRKLVFAARQWIVPASGPRKPKFTTFHRNILIELAFLKAYLAWERFLEESFILYLLGKKPVRRRSTPRSYLVPNGWKHAFELILPETGRRYVDWDNVEFVRKRAKRFFANGEPFESALSARLNLFGEIQTVRNAIAHRSLTSQSKFQNLVRDKLTYLPAGLSVGGFLDSGVVGAHPPATYLDRYFEGLSKTAVRIVP